MQLEHRLAALLALVLVLGLGAWRLRPRTLETIAPCRGPVGVRAGGRMIAVCLGAERTADVDQVLSRARLGRCAGAAKGRVRVGQLVLVEQAGQRCSVTVQALPARLALTLGLRLDLNRAGEQQLQALPRIGPALARRIVDDRDRRGPFEGLEDLQRVRGIGPKTVELLRPLVRVAELDPQGDRLP